MAYEHLTFSREAPLPDRHKRQDKRPRFQPEDPKAYGASLYRSLEAAKESAVEDVNC